MSKWTALETVVRFMSGDVEWGVPDIAYDYGAVFWLKEVGKALRGIDGYEK